MFVRAVCKIQIRKVSSGRDTQSINCSSYWVLVPITHLLGLFSCQLPCRNSQLHDFWKRVWAQQVLTDSPNSHSDSVCQQNTRDLQSRWRQWQKKKKKIKLNNSGNDTNVLDVAEYQCNDNGIQATWACLCSSGTCLCHTCAAFHWGCVSYQIFCQNTDRTYFNVAQKTMQGTPKLFFSCRTYSFPFPFLKCCFTYARLLWPSVLICILLIASTSKV